MAGWTHERGLLEAEVVQRRDEGCVIPAAITDALAELRVARNDWPEERADELWTALARLPEDAALAAAEPNDFAAIRALRPDGPRVLPFAPSRAELVDRMHGAWLGRAIGCALGKPVESAQYGMATAGGRNVGRQRIRELLEARGEWPLGNYFAGDGATPHGPLRCPASTRERIVCMEPDDDIHYTLVGLGVLETVGPEFAWWDVAWYWTRHLPYGAICTAETQAILNFWNRSTRSGNHEHPGTRATPEYTRSFKNPYREWIGAQIRSDGWAWACAGKPELAAEFAYRDACWTHTRNGIYGEMFFAAVQAAAFVERDVGRLIEIGLAEIPRDCRLARWIKKSQGWMRECADLDSALTRLEAADELAAMSPVHTINNAVTCSLALHYAESGVDAATCAAVSGGLDTDCNGATVGSIVGAMTGRSAYQGDLASRLNDTITPEVFGFNQVTMRALAERHAAVWRRVDTWTSARKLD